MTNDIYEEQINILIEQMNKELSVPENYPKQDKIRRNYKKLIEQIENDKASDERKEALIRIVSQIVQEHNIHSIPSSKTYFIHINNDWEELDKEGLRMRFPQLAVGDIDWKTSFDVFLQKEGRIKDGVFSGFSEQNNKLNLLVKSGWILPSDTGETAHPFFDIIMTCLSSGRRDIRNHIEQCILRKVMVPNDTQIPALCFYGEGGIGKNLLVDKVLKAIFNGATNSVLESSFGNFQTTIKNMLVIHLQESKSERMDMDTLKSLVLNDTIQINEKYKKPYEQENFIWWIIGSQDKFGSVRVGNDHSDRRWSIIKCENGMNIDAEIKKRYPLDDIQVWKNKNIANLSDKNQIAQWLYDLEIKHGVQEYAPTAYHGDDYQALCSMVKPLEETIFDTIFKYSDFGFVRSSALYAFYQAFGGKLSMVKFGSLIKSLNDNLPDDKRWTNDVRWIEGQSQRAWFNKNNKTSTLANNNGDWNIPFDLDEPLTTGGGDNMMNEPMNVISFGRRR